MKTAIALAKEMKDQGVILDYAMAGTVAAMFWMEPLDTSDLDFLVIPTPQDAAGPIAGAGMISFLSSKGFKWKQQAVVIDGVPVDFILVPTPLEEEAVRGAVTKRPAPGDSVRVVRPEYLLAIALRVGRTKDLLKAKMLDSSPDVDRRRLEALLDRYKLLTAYRKLEGR